MEETSLEDFLDTDEGSEGGGAEGVAADSASDETTADSGSGETGGDSGSSEAPERVGDNEAAVVPETNSDGSDGPAVTATWSPAGGTCADCGETARWRWTAAGALVCRDCKEW